MLELQQYGNLFNVKPYGNVWVTTLLIAGILGVGYLITCVLNLVKRIRRENIAFLLFLFLFYPQIGNGLVGTFLC